MCLAMNVFIVTSPNVSQRLRRLSRSPVVTVRRQCCHLAWTAKCECVSVEVGARCRVNAGTAADDDESGRPGPTKSSVYTSYITLDRSRRGVVSRAAGDN